MNKFELSAWHRLGPGEELVVNEYSKKYMDFIDKSKTERTCATEIMKQAKENGYIDIEKIIADGSKLEPGMKIFANNYDKSVAMFIIGEKSIENGLKLVGSHIDSPRIDLKPNPLYQDGNMALFKTHYYGGIKKYQWATIPLALYGTVFTKDGEKIDIAIGDEEGDPVFFINDLLIHLASDQMQQKAGDVIKGEQLNLLVGSIPQKLDEEGKEVSDAVKKNVLSILEGKYNIDERSFLTAEFEIVPAGKAKEVGFDRSMVAAYGHDDRVCAYASLLAILETQKPELLTCAIFMDKEEVGSQGNTGMHSRFFENTLAELINLEGDYSELTLRRSLAKAKVLSADVNTCFDPSFPEVMEKKNAAMLGAGVTLTKYTGSRGKGGCNDANAEFVHEVATIFDQADVVWQVGELGKVDQGGGGTIAYILANYGSQVIDCGTPVLSMHAPFELVSKVDAYMTYRAYKEFSK